MKVTHAIFFWALALLIFLSLYSYDPMDVGYNTTHPNDPVNNSVGIIGAWAAFGALFSLGFSSYSILFILVYLGGSAFLGSGDERSRAVGVRAACAILMIVSLACLLHLPTASGMTVEARKLNLAGAGGIVGEVLCLNVLIPYLGVTGSLVVCAAVFVMATLVFTRFNLFYFAGLAMKRLFAAARRTARVSSEVIKHKRRTLPLSIRKVRVMQSGRQGRRPRKAKIIVAPPKEVQHDLLPVGNDRETPSRREGKEAASRKAAAKARKPRTKGSYKLPGIDLLHDAVSTGGRKMEENLQKNVEVLQATLKEFGIDAEVGNVIRGPVITRYEVHPAPGVKVQKITTLADDLALAMAASSIRIVAPIPGRSAVGIEIPNLKATLVGLKEMLTSKESMGALRRIPLAVGKEISGRPVMGDLTNMPHLLIAGSTGSGKTVCVNSMILTMLFALGPDELKLLLIDPKRVEMTQYRGLPHLIVPVITEARKAAQALRWAGREMERRYELFSQQLVRNIESFNKKLGKSGKGMVDDDGEPLSPLPYIVIIIDELADLILVARKDVEDPIIRLAQMGRAAGVHIILATQRPSVNVITGLIKANFPTRIAFKVASKVDSKVILDTMGADKLIGKGDMIFIPPGSSRRLRVQGTLVEDDEIELAVDFVKSQAGPEYREDVFTEGEELGPSYEDIDDSLYDEAVNLVTQLGQASASMLQRRMRIGYARAGRLIDMMEERGVVGPQRGSKPREILRKSPK